MQLGPQHNTHYIKHIKRGKTVIPTPPKSGEEDAPYRNVDAFSVCLLKGARETLGD